ncbi:MAG: TRZ/ATZ family hydrolase [Gammaproteobacteria bacterium]|nr:TRZ/ATZ family hydrolase [Gammaproteobacteria bacterium]MCY4218653.1 TRZ/ATZ family hydrolase [Gammaproteobacteria bacterium]MCY4274799.1 TRZ/ATZ family hydrolase [Gammaproteobacteria bacterium]
MEHVEQILFPKWIIPVDETNSIYEDCGIVIDAGRIVEVADKSKLEAKYSSNEVAILDDHAIIPGLVNAHTHAPMTLFRGLADDLPMQEWLNEHIWPAEAKWVDEEFVRAGTNLACAEMLRSGTTCFNDMYFFPNIVAEQCEACGIRACIGMIVIEFPTIWAKNPDEYIQKGLDLRTSLKKSTLITTCFSPHAPYTVSDNTLKQIVELSTTLDCQVHIHVHETAEEVERAVCETGIRPLERLHRLGLLNKRLMAVHMTQLTMDEIQTVAEHKAHVIHCPESNLKLSSGNCSTGKLIDHEVNVALGTDGAASNNDLDMFGEMHTASLLAKIVGESATYLDSYTTLRIATLNGAKALNLDHEIGSIESGKSADLVAVNLSHPATQPCYSPVSQIVYSTSRDQVTDVWIAGKRLLNEGKLTTIDEHQSISVARDWRDKIYLSKT